MKISFQFFLLIGIYHNNSESKTKFFIENVYQYYSEENILFKKKQRIKKKLLLKQINSFTPIIILGNMFDSQVPLIVTTIAQLILGNNLLNIITIIFNILNRSYGTKETNYIFSGYLLTVYLYILYEYFKFKDLEIKTLDKIGLFFSLLFFLYYFYNTNYIILLPVVFCFYSWWLLPDLLTRNYRKINETFIQDDYTVYNNLI